MCGVVCHPHFLPAAIIAYFLAPAQLSRWAGSRGQQARLLCVCVEDIDVGRCVCVCNSVYVSVVMRLWYTFHLRYFTVCVFLCPCTQTWCLCSCAVGVVCCCVVGCGVHTPQVHSVLQGLMLHIVMQQRVTLDCVLLPPLQTAHSHHTHKICTVCTCVQNIRRHLFQLGYITFVVAACFRLPLYNVCSIHGIV